MALGPVTDSAPTCLMCGRGEDSRGGEPRPGRAARGVRAGEYVAVRAGRHRHALQRVHGPPPGSQRGVTLPPPYDGRTPTLEEILMGVERPPGDDEDQFPAVDALRRAETRRPRRRELGRRRTQRPRPGVGDRAHLGRPAGRPPLGRACGHPRLGPGARRLHDSARPRPARERRHHPARLVCFPLVRAALPAAETWASTTVLLRAVRELGASVARSPWHRTALREGTELPYVTARGAPT